jgi:sugar/nucleoside kinase (ribokinase family)
VRILIAGELNPDLILRHYDFFPTPGKEVLVKDLELTLGSSSAICAVGLARLGNEVRFVGNVGQDLYGDYCVAFLQREGIDTSFIRRRADLKTGITVSITYPADRALITYPGAISSLTREDLPDSLFAGSSHFHVSAYFLQDGLRSGLKTLFRGAHQAGATTSLDTGWDPAEKWDGGLIDTLTEVDIFLPNESEIRAITGCENVLDGIARLQNGRTLIVGKLGADGCVALCQGRLIHQPAFPVNVIDTTGAGDSFVAGFLHARLRSQPIEECLRFASACGALSTRGVGGTAAQPTCSEAEAFLRAQTTAALRSR